MTDLTPNDIFLGNPRSPDHQPDPAEIASLLNDIRTDTAAAVAGVNRLVNADLATTANITLSGEQTIDGTLTSASRVMVKDQTDATENGIYVTAAGAWSRAADADADAEIAQAYVRVSSGTANAGTSWAVVGSPALGSADVNFVQVDSTADLAAHEALANPHGATTDDITQGSTNLYATASSIATIAAAASAKGVLVDADTLLLIDSEDSDSLKKVTRGVLNDHTHAVSDVTGLQAALDEKADVLATAYTNSGGQGDRSATITVTADAGVLTAGLAQGLVDGDTSSNNNTNSAVLSASAADGDGLTFDFGPGSRKRVSEVRFYQTNNGHTHGVWKWQASDDGTAWTDVGSSFTLGATGTWNGTYQTHDLSANGGFYRLYRLEKVSGTASAGPYIYELEFSLVGDAADGLVGLPTGGKAGRALRKTNADDFAVAFEDDPFRTHHASAIAEWLFDEGEGDTAHDLRGSADITWDATHLSTYSTNAPDWSPEGLRLDQAAIVTPALTNVRELALLAFIPADLGASEVLLDYVSSGNKAYISGSQMIAGGGLSVGRADRVADAVYGADDDSLALGHYQLLFLRMDGDYSAPLWLGGPTNGTSAAARPSGVKLLWAGAYGSTLDAAGREVVRNGLRRLARSRGIYIDWRDCPQEIPCVFALGQSNNEGDALVTELPAADQLLGQIPSTYLLTAGKASESYMRRAEQLALGVNTYSHKSPVTVAFGLEYGMARAHAEANSAKPLGICKIGASSSALSLISGNNNTWHPDNDNSALFDHAMQRAYEFELSLLARGLGPRWIAMTWTQGEQEAGGSMSDPLAKANAYQTNLTTLIASVRAGLGQAALPVQITRLNVAPWTTGGYNGNDPTYANIVRTAQEAVATADANVSVVDADSATYRADALHFDAATLLSLGRTHHAGFDV